MNFSQFNSAPSMNITQNQDPIPPKYGHADLPYTATILKALLGIEYVLYAKTQNFHWNLTGMSFVGIHKLLGKHYEQVGEFIDQIAEQIRKYGQATPGSLREFLSINDQVIGIEENPGLLIKGEAVASLMVVSHEIVIQNINNFDNNRIDLATQNMLGTILDFHMKAAWIWRSHLE